MREKRVRLDYLIGTMMELPRASFMAGSIAREAEVFFIWYQRFDANHVGLES